MPEGFGLGRFVDAQERVYGDVVAELAARRKRTHWMWFIFPQIAGLGFSPTAVFFAIGSIAEARAYAEHPLLGARLRECAALMLAARPKTAVDILGPVDAVKFRSSMTLFAAARPREGMFQACLDAYYDGERDPRTLARLESGPRLSEKLRAARGSDE